MNKKAVIDNVQKELFAMQDTGYRDFHMKLMPTVDPERVIGVRTPALRAFAKKYGKTEEAKQFVEVLPHQYYEENNLHGLLLEKGKNYEKCVKDLDRFLPYVDIEAFERREQILELRAKVLQAEQERIEGAETISVSEARIRLRERINDL